MYSGIPELKIYLLLLCFSFILYLGDRYFMGKLLLLSNLPLQIFRESVCGKFQGLVKDAGESFISAVCDELSRVLAEARHFSKHVVRTIIGIGWLFGSQTYFMLYGL